MSSSHPVVPWSVVGTVDYHTAGEPFRIVAEPSVDLPGVDVADRRARAMVDPQVEYLRQFLCHEPRGHADMYGGFLVPPDDDGADLGVLFWHKDGFSTACGHGTIALAVWAVESGRIAAPRDGVAEVRIDVPSGRVRATVHLSAGAVTGVDFVNVPSRVVARHLPVPVGTGTVPVTLAFGGALYATLPASAVGLQVVPEDLPELIRIGRGIKWAANDLPEAKHPTDDRLSGVYGTIFFDDLGPDEDGNPVQRNVTVFADGEVDRSPCGSGTCARVAVLHDDGVLTPGAVLQHFSIVGSLFRAQVVQVLDGPEVVVSVSGTAHRTGRSEFVLDPRDPLAPGFVLR